MAAQIPRLWIITLNSMDCVKNAIKFFNKQEEVNKMPREDRTGPTGLGPMTGRRMGICAGYPDPGFMSNSPGYGLGRGMRFGRGSGRGMGFDRGRGWRRGGYGGYWEYPPQSFTQQDEVAYLEDHAKEIKEDLSRIKSRLEELKKSKDQSGEK